MAFLWADSDAELVRRTLTGEQTAYSALVERHLRSVYAVSQAWAPDRADVEDISQEAFLAAYMRLPSLRDPRKFKGWLVQIARNIAVSCVRRRSREGEVMERFKGESSDGLEATVSEAEQREARALVRREIDRLDGHAREVVLLHYFAGKKSREIAQLLEISPAAVRKRLQRARETLGERLLVLQRAEEQEEEETWKARAQGIVGMISVAKAPWVPIAVASIGNAASGVAAGGGRMLTGSMLTKVGIVSVVAGLGLVSGISILGSAEQDAAVPEAMDDSVIASDPVRLAQAESTDPAGEADAASETDVGTLILTSLKAVIEASPPVRPDPLTGPCAVTGWVDDPGATLVMVRTCYAGLPMPPEEAINVTAIPDEYGSFIFPDLPAGKYVVMAFTEGGFDILPCRTDVDPEAFLALHVKPTQPFSGRVVNEAGHPVGGATLYVHEYSIIQGAFPLPESTATAFVTESDGTFCVPHGLPGRARFWVKAPGYAATLSSWVETGTEGNEIVIERGAVLVGEVVDAASGDPLPNIPITLCRGKVHRDRHETVSGSEGHFRIEGLRAETYELSIGRSTWVNADGLVEVEVEEDQEVINATIRGVMGCMVGGRVYDVQSGQGIPGVRLTIASASEPPHVFLYKYRRVYTDGDGYYSCDTLPAGPCRISARRIEGYPYQMQEFEPVVVAYDEPKMDVDMPIEPGIPVSGFVFDACGNPAGLVKVTAKSPMGEGKCVSKSDGTFLCALPVGGATVTLSARKPGIQMRPMDPIPLPPEGLTGLALNLDATGALEGRVIDPDGDPLSITGLSVSAMHKIHPRYASHHNYLDAEGRFAITTLLPGPTALKLVQLGGPSTPILGEVTVLEGETLEGIVLEYDPAPEEDVEVTDGASP